MIENPQASGDAAGGLVACLVVSLIVAALDSSMQGVTTVNEADDHPTGAPQTILPHADPPLGRYDHLKRACQHIGRAVWPSRPYRA